MSNEAAWAYVQFPPGYCGYAVELGALDGVYLSNTLLLEEKGWTVLCIEPNPTHHAALRKNRKLAMFCACDREPRATGEFFQFGDTPPFTHAVLRNPNGPPADAQFGRTTKFVVPVMTLDRCLEIAEFPRLDVLSLDVDGIERDILEGFDLERWAPRAVIIEEGVEKEMADALPGYLYDCRHGENGCYLRAT